MSYYLTQEGVDKKDVFGAEKSLFLAFLSKKTIEYGNRDVQHL
jgi:hypothetical protein